TSELVSKGVFKRILSSRSTMLSIRIANSPSQNAVAVPCPKAGHHPAALSILVPTETTLLFLCCFAGQRQNTLATIVGAGHEHYVQQRHWPDVGVAKMTGLDRYDETLLREARNWRNKGVGDPDAVSALRFCLAHALNRLTQRAMKADGEHQVFLACGAPQMDHPTRTGSGEHR